ncbi:hypothetical protein [Amycolatopsis alba]|uniref:Uncharacterized protein n=1 Tax=Amycolatopsis alba DSM 44262 TaxID=1125972 RepID=A0A229REG6_AMYAL|nr:hypothetical protein [Amycolatopsis alba]OXM44814.1 hypothetical protein CFP75_33370 [Amycolatopsis alba DSM 44262]
MSVPRWLAIAAAVLAVVAVWALSVEVSTQRSADRPEVVCGSATGWSEQMQTVLGGGLEPGQGTQALVSEEAHRQIEACRDVRNRQALIGALFGGGAVLCAGFAVFVYRRTFQHRH